MYKNIILVKSDLFCSRKEFLSVLEHCDASPGIKMGYPACKLSLHFCTIFIKICIINIIITSNCNQIVSDMPRMI